MFPASTVKLKPGDFCFIPRNDGSFALLAFLCAAREARSYFYGGILNATTSTPNIESLPNRLNVTDYALLHIKCFKKNETPIAGNIAGLIGSEQLEALKRDAHDLSVGSASKVWGHRTIFKYANLLDA